MGSFPPSLQRRYKLLAPEGGDSPRLSRLLYALLIPNLPHKCKMRRYGRGRLL